MGTAVLETAKASMGQHDEYGSAGRVYSQRACVAFDDRPGQGPDRQYQLWAAQKYVGNAVYGIAKAATDKMSSDMAHELRSHGVAVVSLYPGLVRTEAVMAAAQGGWLDVSNSESPEFIGRVIAALSQDSHLMERSGQVVVAAELAEGIERG